MGDLYLSDRGACVLPVPLYQPIHPSMKTTQEGTPQSQDLSLKLLLVHIGGLGRTTRLVPGLHHVGSKESKTGCNQGSARGKAGLQGDKAAEEDIGKVGPPSPQAVPLTPH